MKVWVVYRSEYGMPGGSIIHICATREIAESYRSYEYMLDIEGPVYSIKEMKVKKEPAVCEEMI